MPRPWSARSSLAAAVTVERDRLDQAKRIAASSEGEPAARPHVNKWRNLMVGIFLTGAWSLSLVFAGAFGYRIGWDNFRSTVGIESLSAPGSPLPEENPTAVAPVSIPEKSPDLGPVRTDAQGKEYVSLDQNRDGFFETRQYDDAEGRAVEHHVDQNKDGKIDLIREFDDEGLLTHEREDTNGDGRYDRWIEFNAVGIATREFHDLDFDGTRDMESELDETGEVRKSITTFKGRPVSEAWFRNSLSERELVDLNRDGKLDTELLFDKFGVLRKITKLKP